MEKLIISYDHINTLKKQGLAIDGAPGGFLVGPSIQEGGIPCLVRCEGGYTPLPTAEGEMYLLNPKATARFKMILEGLNNLSEDVAHPTYFRKTAAINPQLMNCHVFDHEQLQHTEVKTLLFEPDTPYYFMNLCSTWRHLELLDWMNKEEPWHPQEPQGVEPAQVAMARPWWHRAALRYVEWICKRVKA